MLDSTELDLGITVSLKTTAHQCGLSVASGLQTLEGSARQPYQNRAFGSPTWVKRRNYATDNGEGAPWKNEQ